jgi:hypothetical protein
MLLEDILEILPLLMPKTFIDQVVFVWGHEQCTATTSHLTLNLLLFEELGLSSLCM